MKPIRILFLSIYADPHEGGIYAVSENYFNGCNAFVIEGINQNRMRLLLQ